MLQSLHNTTIPKASQDSPQQDQQQGQNGEEEVRKQLSELVEAFNQFYEKITEYKKQQNDIATQIRKRVDQQKLEQIKNTLDQIKQ